MSSPLSRRSACCPGSTTSVDQPNSPSAAAVATPATPAPAMTTSTSMFGMLAGFETGQSPCREIRVVEPIVEHCGAKEHAIDAVLRPTTVRLLARDEPLDTAMHRGRGLRLDLEQCQNR